MCAGEFRLQVRPRRSSSRSLLMPLVVSFLAHKSIWTVLANKLCGTVPNAYAVSRSHPTCGVVPNSNTETGTRGPWALAREPAPTLGGLESERRLKPMCEFVPT